MLVVALTRWNPCEKISAQISGNWNFENVSERERYDLKDKWSSLQKIH